MDEKTLQAVIVSNTVVMSVFILQKVVDYIFSAFAKKNEKQEHTIDELIQEVGEIKTSIAALRAQMEITLQQVFRVQKIEKDVHALAEKVRSL